MMTQKTDVLELGYFMDGPDDSALASYQALIRTIDDGMILPSEWTAADGEGGPIGLADSALGSIRYISFTEIPEDGNGLWGMGGCGLGFSQAFLTQQGVDAVNYLVLGEDIPYPDPAGWLREMLADMHENPEEYGLLQAHARTAQQVLEDDPALRTALRERIAGYTNATRAFNEIIHPDMALEELPGEWRGTQPVFFTLDDVQTVYVNTTEEVSHFRMMYPSYRGTFVALC